MSYQRAQYYQNLRQANMRNAKESFSARLDREHDAAVLKAAQENPSDELLQAEAALVRASGTDGAHAAYERYSALLKARKAAEAAKQVEPVAETAQAVVEAVVETTTTPPPVTELVLEREEVAPVAKRPIREIRAEVCHLANSMRQGGGMTKSAAMREAWRMVKGGRAAFPVSGTSFNGRQEALKRLTQYKPEMVHAFLVP
jgi:hypothetical protein